MSFENQKKQFLSKPDKSGIKSIDKEILPLINLINSKNEYFTTSSCAGRILLMPETGKKQENVFLFVTHNSISVKEIRDNLNSITISEKKNENSKSINKIIYLKHEPCILHVACKNLKSAQYLTNGARQSGWKKSGIISIKEDKVTCELVSTELLAVPLMKNGKMLVSDNYLNLLAAEANKKLKQTRMKIKNLSDSLNK